MACPDCLREFSYPASRGGQAINCPKCSAPVRLAVVPGSLKAVTGSALAKKAAEEEDERLSRFDEMGPEVYQPASFALFFGVVALLLAGALWMSPGPRLSITLAALAGLSGLTGISLGLLSIINIWVNRGTYSGLGLAIPGLLMSILFGGVTPVNPVRNAFAELRNESTLNRYLENMEKVAAGHRLYHDRIGRMPHNILDRDGKPLLSWRVSILPELGEQQLYDKFNLDEPWDSPANIELIPLMPKALVCTPASMESGFTACMHPIGPAAMYSGTDRRMTLTDLVQPDGPSVTLILAEVKPELACQWTKPADWEFSSSEPRDGLPLDPLMAFANGSVIRLPRDVSREDLAAYLSAGGKEPVSQLKTNR